MSSPPATLTPVPSKVTSIFANAAPAPKPDTATGRAVDPELVAFLKRAEATRVAALQSDPPDTVTAAQGYQFTCTDVIGSDADDDVETNYLTAVRIIRNAADTIPLGIYARKVDGGTIVWIQTKEKRVNKKG